MIVYVIGITGVGKSSLGKKLARRIGYGFVDLDAWIEIREKQSISHLFKKGEQHFRECETHALKSLKSKRPLVVATGGGIVVRDENIKWMQKHGFVIHLVRPVHKIAGVISTKRRPLLKKNPKVLFDLYKSRKHLYEKARHVHIHCNNRKVALEKMINEVRKYENSHY